MQHRDELTLSFKQGIQSDAGYWYNALQQLGKGGNAVTWLMIAGSGPFKGTPFALKIFRRVSKPERRQSFLQEMRFLRTCDHPAIMRTYDEGLYRENHPFVVAEYLPQTLAQVIRSGRTSMVEKINYVLQLLSALKQLADYDPQVIHRDIKPANVFVKGTACVLGDFGLMKMLDARDDESPEETLKRSVGAGMPFFYRTPDLVEYANGNAVPTVASDVFQLGLVVAGLFTGRNPQKRAGHDDFRSPIEMEPLRPVAGSRGGVISALIQGMLEMDPSNRPTSDLLLEQWANLFFAVARDQHAIEGRVFL
jgi:serine/threonine protein kinase